MCGAERSVVYLSRRRDADRSGISRKDGMTMNKQSAGKNIVPTVLAAVGVKSIDLVRDEVKRRVEGLVEGESPRRASTLHT